MKLSTTAEITIKVDENAYIQNMLDEISAKLATEYNFQWKNRSYGDYVITLSGGSEAQYTRYEAELTYRIAAAKLDRLAKVIR